MKKFLLSVVFIVSVSLVHGWWFSAEADIFPEEDVTTECLRQANWGRCEFYECLERRFPCGSDGYINRVALHFCHKVASIFDSFNERTIRAKENPKLSHGGRSQRQASGTNPPMKVFKGRQWMNGTSRCLTTSLRQIYNSDQTTCSAIKEAGAESLTSCNARVERDGSNFCDFVQENTDAYQSIFSTSDISRMVGMRKPGVLMTLFIDGARCGASSMMDRLTSVFGPVGDLLDSVGGTLQGWMGWMRNRLP